MHNEKVQAMGYTFAILVNVWLFLQIPDGLHCQHSPSNYSTLFKELIFIRFNMPSILYMAPK